MRDFACFCEKVRTSATWGLPGVLLERKSSFKSKNYFAADFSLLNLPKGKSLGRSKPATNS
jgi:hypothetical protein